MKQGTDIMLESLAKNGIDLAFGYPGGAIMPLYDKLENFDGIKHILVRNEQGAAFAAQGVSRSTDKLGLAIGTSGPGATNLITGIMDAYMDSIPTIFITGQVALGLMGNDVFQEVDIFGATMSCVKHSFVIRNVQEIPSVVEEAVKIATTGRPGPVLIDFPKDVSIEKFDKKADKIKLNLNYNRKPKNDIKEEEIKKFVKLLNESEKPILLIGQGIKFSKAEEELLQFVNSLGIPTVSTLLGKGVLREDNENYLGMLGMHGFYEANLATHNADLIISIGSRFDDRIVGNYDSFGKNAKIIHIDIDKSELNKVVKTKLPIHCDAKNFLNKISEEKLTYLNIGKWRNQINDWKNLHPFQKETEGFSTKNALNSINKITEKNLDNYIFVTDVGQHQMWASQIIKVFNTKSWLTSGGSGTMGFGIPTGMGASEVNPHKQVVVIVGDGGVQMNIQELQVIAEHNLNVNIIIMNNNYLGMVRQWQDLFFDKNYASTPITSPDYLKIADAYGINGYRVENEEKLEKILEKVFNKKGPSIIEVTKLLDEDNIFPMVTPGMSLGETIWNKKCLK